MNVIASVPDEVIGLPAIDKPVGTEAATLVTVPVYVSAVKYPLSLVRVEMLSPG